VNRQKDKRQNPDFEEGLASETLSAALRDFPLYLDLLETSNGAMLHFAASLMTALGHPTRLRIIQVLRNGSMTVGRISSELGISQSNASQHLAVLLRVGAVVKEPEGSSRKYSLREPRLAKILEIIEEMWETHQEDILAENPR